MQESHRVYIEEGANEVLNTNNKKVHVWLGMDFGFGTVLWLFDTQLLTP